MSSKESDERLIEAVAATDRELPFDVDRLIALTEYAVPLRYEDLLDTEPLDRAAAVSLLDGVGRWAEGPSRAASRADART